MSFGLKKGRFPYKEITNRVRKGFFRLAIANIIEINGGEIRSREFRI